MNVLKKLQGLSLEKKYIFSIVSCVILSIAVLTALIIRRETIILESDTIKNAEILATSISREIKSNMLGGQSGETVGLIKELSDIKGVQEIAVLTPDWRYAFGMSGTAIEIRDDMKDRILKGHEETFAVRNGQYFIKPLLNEKQCRKCHPDNEPIRGAVVINMATNELSQLKVGLMERMAGFGVAVAVLLSALLIILGKWMLTSQIKGLTEAARQIALGNFVLFRQRGAHCYEMLNCTKTECPSFKDDTIPCWLKSGTLCDGKPVGDFALKIGNCLNCKVYKESRGDEIRQLIDKFNKMSLMLTSHQESVKMHVGEIERVNLELTRSNAKLGTLLDASRLTTSTLELNEILSTSLKIILNVTNLKAGIILLLEDEIEKRCYEFFGCDARNCPAYKAAINCWRLSGTMCHGDRSVCPFSCTPAECWRDRQIHTHYTAVKDFDGKMKSCSSCEFFATIVLIPKMVAGFQNGTQISKKLGMDCAAISQALVMGKTIVDYSKENPFSVPFETATELAVPLKMQEQMIGILYLASDKDIHYDRDEIEFFQLLSEVISSGIFNSRLYDDMGKSYLQTVMAFANAIEAKDPYTKGHTERVADLCIKIADNLNLSQQEKEHLKFAALLHDIGKIGISKDILWKHCSLDECEEEEVKSHPDKGIQILDPVHFLRPVFPAIKHHHEKFDGSGYPAGLKGKEIPFKARIISVADAWDAMRSNRPYRDALSLEDAKRELLQHAGTHFDPEVTEAFLKTLTS